MQKNMEGGEEMFRHYITKYSENGQRYAESWIQIEVLGKYFCLWKKRIKI
ncbi:TPA: hypothetical protein U1C40_000053 [Streptococcus suis]|nr:hypothetical protein [Streptococcus suis]HEM3647477.1 hypothetical protein [Streptococcus suis]